MASGRQGLIGIGKETAFGTPVPATVFFNGTESLSETRARLREAMTFGSRALQPADAGRLRINGNIDGMHARPGGLGHLLRAALGEPVTTGASTPYTHSFKPAAAKFSADAALPSYSITVKRSASVIHQYAGAQLNTLTLNQPMDGALEVSSAWIAKGVADVAAPTLVQETAGRLRYNQLVVTRGGAAFTLLESVGITINNNLEVEELLDGTHEITGTDFGDSQIAISLSATFRDTLAYADFKANTTAAWSFKWTSGADSLEIKVPKLNIDTWGAPISGPGRMTVSATGQAEYDSVAGHGLEVILINSTATY